MKGLYIANVDSEINRNMVGVKRKINGQINAFRELGIHMDYIFPENNIITFNGADSGKKFKGYSSGLMNTNLFFSSLKNMIIGEYDFVYIRFTIANFCLYKLVKYLKFKNIKVFIEIPTYPYEDEYPKNFKNKILMNIDKLLWKQMKKHVYKVVLTNNIDDIFGIETICINNGIDLNDVKIKESICEKDIINMIGVANISSWHGYDRIIRGLYEYYQNSVNEEVNFYIVGDGRERDNLINLTEELGVSKYVHFMGVKHGKELDEIFNKTNIGVSSLALFRAGGGHDPIKSKEYIGKGIPVLLGYKDRALMDELDFVFSTPENDSAVNIKSVINKYKNMNITTKEIRNYAEKNLTWKSQMYKVIEEVL